MRNRSMKRIVIIGMISTLLGSDFCMAASVSGNEATIEEEMALEQEAEESSESLQEIEIDAESATVQEDEYTVAGNVITVKAQEGQDITKPLDHALAAAKDLATASNIVTVTVPKGNYLLSGILHIYSNTTLNLYDVTLTCDKNAGNFNMLITGTTSYNNSAACSGYTGFENISLLGGKYVSNSENKKTQIRLFHATNVTVKDVTISGGGSDHMLEVVALDNFLVDGCTFENMTKSVKSEKREALQLDIACHDSIYPDIIKDGTMMRNVVVQNCNFINVSRGIGSHSVLLNAYHDTIKILNNTFRTIEQECVIALNYTNVEISGNVMEDCGGGVLFQYAKGQSKTIFTTLDNGKVKFENGKQVTDAKSVIKNNTIVTKYNQLVDEDCGIKLFGREIVSDEKNEVDGGTIPKGNYYVGGVVVEENNITTSGYGIILNDAKNCTIANNTITGADYSVDDPITQKGNYNGIHLGKGSTDNVISGNVIKNVQSSGIFLQDQSSATQMNENKIADAGKDGITIYDSSCVEKDIISNEISDAGRNGITVDKGSDVKGSIRKNSIATTGKEGIKLYAKSVVGGSIAENAITGVGNHAIVIDNSSKIKDSICDNVIKSAKKCGIYILNKSVVSQNISKNNLSKVGENAICVNTSAQVKGDLADNKINTAKRYGIYILNKAKASGSIENNEVTRCEMPIVIGSNVVATVKVNSLKKNKSNIYNFQNTKIKTGKLSAPTIKGAKYASKVLTVKTGKVKNATGYVVEVSTKKDFSKITKTAESSKNIILVKGLKAGKTYYVRVRAVASANKNAKLIGAASKSKEISAKK